MVKFEKSLIGSRCLATCAVLLGAGWSSTSVANEAASSDLSPVCLVRPGVDGKPLAIIVPAESEKAMRDKGFTQESCDVNFATLAARESFRDAICHTASTYRADQIAAFERAYGERPGVLCGMAEVAVSQWRLRG